MEIAQSSIEQQRQQIIEEVQSLPAESLQDLADQIERLHEAEFESNKAKQTPEPAKPSPYEAFKEAGLIGCIKDAPPDLSINYKEYLAKGLQEKHGNR